MNNSNVISLTTLYLPILINERIRTWLCSIVMLSNLTVLVAVFGLGNILIYRYVSGEVHVDLSEGDSNRALVVAMPYVLCLLVVVLLTFNWLVFYVRTTLKTSPGRIYLIQQDYILYLQYFTIFLLTFGLPTIMSYLMFTQYSNWNKFEEALKLYIDNYYTDRKFKQAVDQMQIDYKCCGKVDPYTDWKYVAAKDTAINKLCDFPSNRMACVLIPHSCCDSSSNYSCNAIRPSKERHDKNGFYHNGCVDILNNQFNLSLFHILILLSVIFAALVIISIAFQYLRVSVHNAIINDHPRLTSYGWLLGKYIDEIEQKDLLKNEEFKFVLKVKLKPMSTALSQSLSGINTNKVSTNARYIIFDNNGISTLNRDKKYQIHAHEGTEPKVVVSKVRQSRRRAKKRTTKRK